MLTATIGVMVGFLGGSLRVVVDILGYDMLLVPERALTSFPSCSTCVAELMATRAPNSVSA
jgi:hypothetical protein